MLSGEMRKKQNYNPEEKQINFFILFVLNTGCYRFPIIIDYNFN